MRTIVIAALLGCTSVAIAQEPSKIYAHAGGGTAMAFGAGYLFNERFAIEGRLASFGQVAQSETFPTASTRTHTTWSTEGAGLLAVGRMPINRYWTVHGTAGAYRMRTDVATKNSEKPPLFVGYVDRGSSSETTTSVVPAIGVGASLELSKWSAMRAELERLNAPAAGAGAINSFTLSAVARF